MQIRQVAEHMDRALAGTGIEYPRDGFTESYPQEGTWADVLAILRDG